MPNNIRAILTVIVLLVGFAVFAIEHNAGEAFLKWLALGLAAFMALAVWLFPEAKSKAGDRK